MKNSYDNKSIPLLFACVGLLPYVDMPVARLPSLGGWLRILFVLSLAFPFRHYRALKGCKQPRGILAAVDCNYTIMPLVFALANIFHFPGKITPGHNSLMKVGLLQVPAVSVPNVVGYTPGCWLARSYIS